MKNPIHSVVFAPCLTPIRLSLLLGDADRLLERAATGGPVLLWTLRYLGTFSLRLLDPWPGQGGVTNDRGTLGRRLQRYRGPYCKSHSMILL